MIVTVLPEIVAGPDKQYIVDAFAKSEGKKKGTVKKEVQELIEKTDANQSLWMIITATALLKSEVASDEKAKKNLEKMNHVTAGVTLSMKNLFGITPNSLYGAQAGSEDATEGRVPLHNPKGLEKIKLPGLKEGITSIEPTCSC